MVTQGTVYDIIQDNVATPGFGISSYLFAQKIQRSKIRSNLQIRFGTADGLDKFINELKRETEIETIDWSSSRPKLRFLDGSSSYLTQLEIEDVSETLDQVLISAYEDILLADYNDALLDELSGGDMSETARLIAAIIFRRFHTNNRRQMDSSFLWDAYNLIETEHYERMARRDVLNKLVWIGCIVRDGSDVYPLPEFTSIDYPENYLPLPTISDEWEK